MADDKPHNPYIRVPPEEEIVISGIAGRFPKSDNVEHLQNNLILKKDLGQIDERLFDNGWLKSYPDIPIRLGKISNIDKFDSEYFDIPFTEAYTMDPIGRLLLEHTYEAIVDAGINPEELRGTKTGVFIGVCFSNAEIHFLYKNQPINSGIFGCSKALQANRISYYYHLIGPSVAVDTACSSSMTALERAYNSIRQGYCESAIVGAANLCLNPFLTLQFKRLGVLAADGFNKSYDEEANGYMRSEAISVLYLQKAKVARRIYATLIYAKANCDGFKEEGITYPSSKMHESLFKEFYEDCGLSPSCLSYLETHGTGTKVGDPVEIKAVENIFCKDRQTPLLIGTVKSNLGHAEAASGLCQIAKVLMAMESGVIGPNINLKHIRKDIEAFEKGSARIIVDPQPWEPGFAGINSFGFGGTNCHILLQANMKQKINNGAPNNGDDLPRIVAISGRSVESIESFLCEIKSRPLDVEYVRLLHALYAKNMTHHPYRGYVIIESNNSENTIKEIKRYSEEERPICFVFSGIGTQWFGMGQDLLRFPVFSETVKKCDEILKRYGMHIIDILTSKQETIFNDALNSLVAIIVMQIGLIDLLTSVNIVPDRVVGYSVGELCCGYVTGIFTIEQVLLSAYYIGLTLKETSRIHGAMADINLSYDKTKSMCPKDIKVIKDNSSNTCSISGPKESVRNFIRKLEINKILVKEINSCNILLHRTFAPARATVMSYLNRTIPQTMTHNQIWYPLFCNTGLSYAEYFTENLRNSVLFENVGKLIPKNAVVVEVAPDGILQPASDEHFHTKSIALVERDHRDNVKVFLQGLGKMYNSGLQPLLSNLYPVVEFPVSRGTPMISPSIKWNHTEEYFVPSFKLHNKLTSWERVIDITLHNDFEFMKDHIIDGRLLFPATGYLFLVWETIALLRDKLYLDVPIVLEDIKFLRATHFSKKESILLIIIVQKSSGKFEIIEGDNAIVTGVVRVPSDLEKEKTPADFQHIDDDEEEIMKTKDIYKELKLRGYQYAGLFRALKSSSVTGSRGHITWLQNWVAFMDNMLQMRLLNIRKRKLYVPTEIQKVVIDPKCHEEHLQKLQTEEKHLPVYLYKYWDTLISGGIEIRGIKVASIRRRKIREVPVLEEYRFVVHRDNAKISLKESLILVLHLVLECQQMRKINIIELIEEADEIEELMYPFFVESFNNVPLIQFNISVVNRTTRFEDITVSPNVTVSKTQQLSYESKTILAVGSNLLAKDREKNLKEVISSLKSDGFLLTRGEPLTTEDIAQAEKHNLSVVLEKRTEKEHIVLLRKRKTLIFKTEIIFVNNYEFSWLEHLKSCMMEVNLSNQFPRILLVGEKDPDSGILGLVNSLLKEPKGDSIRGMFIQDETAPKFSLNEPLYAEQLQLDLAINVLSPGKLWGSYRHLPLAPLTPKPVYHAYINQMINGDLSSFRWLEGPITPDYKDNDVVRIIYAPINFKDIMYCTGRLTDFELLFENLELEDCLIGMEYVGINNAGRRVMGMQKTRCVSNMQVIDKNLCWEIPDHWTLEDAATVPVVYSTCCFGLYFKGKMKKGDKVLIHSGTGAVGQAAIHLALYEGCEVFTTVGTLEKRKFIRDTFPSIPEDHIGNSRDTSFEQMILEQTQGRGVDIVLNSLAEEKLQASLRCLARKGRFLEIGKFDLMANNTLDMSIFLKGITFYGVVLDAFINRNDKNSSKMLHSLVQKSIDNGAIKPLIRKIVEKNEIENLFRYMTFGKHIGKMIIKMRDETKSTNEPILAFPRYHCLANKTYLIFGGLGGVGLELANWLICRGARNLVLVSRTGIKNGYQQMRIKQWKSYGVNVLIISNLDASNAKDCERILLSAEELAPIDAIFNLAVVLDDKILQNHTVGTFQTPFEAKAWTTKNLDLLSRTICSQLRHFVVFSSVSCGKGNAGQTNYAMANSVMERICERRVSEGLHGLAIQWGAIGDVGIVANILDDEKEIVISGTLPQKILSCLEKFEEFMLQEKSVASSMVVAEKTIIMNMTDIVGTVASIMSLKDLSNISPFTRLPELGMDSMMAVEIKQTLEREFNIFLTAQEIRNLNFDKLAKIAIENHGGRCDQRDPI